MFDVKRCRLPLIVLGLMTSLTCAAEPEPVRLTNPFGAFSFTIEKRPAAEQVALLAKLGYQGMTVGAIGMGGGVALLKSYSEVPQVQRGEFAIYGILWWLADARKPLDTAWLDQVLPLAAKLKAPLWVVVAGKRGDTAPAVPFLQAVADRCRAQGVELVLYPHNGCTFESTEEGLALWQKLERPEVKLSVHLCHELLVGNGARLDEVIAKVKSILYLVSISGAEVPDGRRATWKNIIMPLDRGNYDFRPYLRALAKHGYRGPVILHTWGIKDPPEEHLARSMARWRQLTAELGGQG